MMGNSCLLRIYHFYFIYSMQYDDVNTHVIPTNSLFYSLYVQSFTQLLCFNAIISPSSRR